LVQKIDLAPSAFIAKNERMRNTTWKRIEMKVPKQFLKVARQFGIEPEHLARLLCEKFAQWPPEQIEVIHLR
jgi:hypothetical protein